MGDKNVHPDGAKHTPGKNDGLPSSPAAIIRYERKRAESKRLQTEALEMRRSGYSYREIAAHQNCAVTTAATRVTKAIRREVPQELIDSTRAIELDRIDQMTKNGEVAEDESKRAHQRLQKLVDGQIERVDALANRKEHEVLEI